MQPISTHLVLVSAPGFDNACGQVRDFFDNTLLVRYDRIDIRRQESLRGTDGAFDQALRQGIADNRRTLHRFIGEFEKTGFSGIGDLDRVECGYPSKLLHIITHFLDGFIGIDSKFYNLIDDSHWLPENTAEAIAETPEHYYLIQLDCFSQTPDKVSLVQA